MAREELDGICETLRGTDVFADLGGRQLRRLAARCTEQQQPKGHRVFRRGDASDAVFVLREGGVAVYRDERGRPVQMLARLGAGDVFGELGVLHGETRGATVRTLEPCRLLRIGEADFRRFLEEHGTTSAKLEALAARRRRANVETALEPDSRSETRIHVDVVVTLVLEDGNCLRTTLENVSPAGLALTGVPADWGPEVPVSLFLMSGGEDLSVTGRVIWREGETVGLAFSERREDQAHDLLRFTRELLGKLA